MILECQVKKIIFEMQEQGKVKSFNFENKKYIYSARKIKNNFKLDLKEAGVIFGVSFDESYLPQSYQKI